MDAIKEICQTLQNADNEGTRCPYWMIIDAKRQILTLDKETSYSIAGMITGPFFSRADATYYKDNVRPHAYTDNAVVFCASGHESEKYENLCKELKI